MTPGDAVLVVFPGHAAHGKRAEVVTDEARFNVAHESETPRYRRIVFIRWAGQDEPVGVGPDCLRLLEQPYDADRDGALCYADAIAAMRERKLRGEPVERLPFFRSTREPELPL